MHRQGPYRHTRFLRQAARNREYEFVPHRKHTAGEPPHSTTDMHSAPSSYFALFNLEPRFALAEVELDGAYRALAARIHPDRFVDADPATQRAALELSANANEAYRTLKKPALRAQHLLGLHGVVANDRSAAMSPAFLMEQMEWREALGEAKSSSDLGALQQLTAMVRQRIRAIHAQLATQLDEQQDHPAAAASVNQLMFVEKLAADIDDACLQLEE